ncbi:WG repeat-containing protein, partial [Kordia jejudonensis]|uniref:WG repeat-containing protein n=1 Tax=Kordia jejudonensis TaxID=1348245 RepID=UPI000629CA65
GEIVIQPQFDEADSFGESELIVIWQNGKCGFLNKKGEIIMLAQFHLVCDFEESELAVIIQNGKYGFINQKGEIVIQPQFDNASSFEEAELAVIEQNKKYGFINKKGEIVIKPQFDKAFDFGKSELAPIKQNSKWGYINTRGEIIVQPQFDKAFGFGKSELASIEQNGKSGYIDKKGKIVIPPQFDETRNFLKYEFARIHQDRKYGCINKEIGKVILQPKFDRIEEYDEFILGVQFGKSWGIVTCKGEYIGFTEEDIEQEKREIFTYDEDIDVTDEEIAEMERILYNKNTDIPEDATTQDLLNDVLWNFAIEKFDDLESFSIELVAYNNALNSENSSDLDIGRIFNSSKEITVQYFYSGEDEDQMEEDFIVSTENENGFMLKEFLFKVHNQICEKMMEEDATYFEGLTPFDDDCDKPFFFLNQGS